MLRGIPNLSHAKGLAKGKSESESPESGSEPVHLSGPVVDYRPIGPGLMLELGEGRADITGKRLGPDLVKRPEKWLCAQLEARGPP